jgi:hypothetical protein
MWFLNRVRQYVAPKHGQLSTLGALLLLVGIFSLLLPTLGTQAATSSCRGDPVVKFANDFEVRLSVELDNDGSPVSQVVYILHGPVGWMVHDVQIPGSPLSNKETFVFYADEPTNLFDANTFVNANVNTIVNVEVQVKGQVQVPNGDGHFHAQNLQLDQTWTGTNNEQIDSSLSW